MDKQTILEILGESKSLFGTVKTVGQLYGVSERHVWAMHAAGRLPEPYRLGRCVRWRLDELMDFIESRARTRDEWKQIKATRDRGSRNGTR